MTNESMDQKPGPWIAVGVLSFVAGAGLIMWTEMTRAAGDSGSVGVAVGGALVGFGVWSWFRGRVLARSRDGLPPTT